VPHRVNTPERLTFLERAIPVMIKLFVRCLPPVPQLLENPMQLLPRFIAPLALAAVAGAQAVENQHPRLVEISFDPILIYY
jgi:hypothetical protein